jgi:hypothetical protein
MPHTTASKRSLRTPAQRRREQERQFKPLAIELGWIAYEWNRLHEALGELFADAMGADTYTALSAWHAVRSDLTQRQMLKATAAHRAKRSAPEDTLLWRALVNLVDEVTKLSDKRNNAIHAPLVFVTDVTGGAVEVEPLVFLGNEKAANLGNRDLLPEFQWYRKSGEVLANYANVLHYALNDPTHQLPPKPILPTLGQKQGSNQSPRRIKRRKA